MIRIGLSIAHIVLSTESLLKPGEGKRAIDILVVWLTEMNRPVSFKEAATYLSGFDFKANSASPALSLLRSKGKAISLGRGMWAAKGVTIKKGAAHP